MKKLLERVRRWLIRLLGGYVTPAPPMTEPETVFVGYRPEIITATAVAFVVSEAADTVHEQVKGAVAESLLDSLLKCGAIVLRSRYDGISVCVQGSVAVLTGGAAENYISGGRL